jgi:hypothetical protein
MHWLRSPPIRWLLTGTVWFGVAALLGPAQPVLYWPAAAIAIASLVTGVLLIIRNPNV